MQIFVCKLCKQMVEARPVAGTLTCPSCHAQFDLKTLGLDPAPTARKSTREPEGSPEPETEADGGLWLAVTGGAALLFAIVLFCVGPLRGLKSDAPQLKQQKAALAGSRTEMEMQLDRLEAKRRELAQAVTSEQKRGDDLRESTRRLDQGFTTLINANAQNFSDLNRQRAAVEESRKNNQEATQKVLSETDPAAIIARCEKSVLVVLTDLGSGSGFLLDMSGLAVTNYHVIAGSTKLTVQMQKKDSREQIKLENATIIAADPDRDLALLQLPPAPATISIDGTYPPVFLRENISAQLGENVFAIGNPGMANMILDYTVTRGIVSNAQRLLGKEVYLQTSAPVNPGNSGGPLFDAQGQVVGVVAAKGTHVEAVTFAIPMITLKDLMNRRTEENFAVKGSLTEWEKTHRPIEALERKSRQTRGTPAFEWSESPTKILIHPSATMAYFLFGESGRVQEFDLEKRRLGREFRAERTMNGLEFEGINSDFLLLHGPADRKILRVATASMAAAGEVDLSADCDALLNVNAINQPAFLMSKRNTTQLIVQGSFDRNRPVVGQWSLDDARFLSGTSNARYTIFSTVTKGTPAIQLQIFPTMPMASQASLITSLHSTQARLAESGPQLEEANKKLEAMRLTFELGLDVLAKDGLITYHLLTYPAADRFIFARRVFRIGSKVASEGVFEPGPLTREANTKRMKDALEFLDNIFTVSSNGKFAASGMCVYDVNTRKPLKLLPFPTAVHAFIKDGKSMLLASADGLYIYDDWAAKFPDIDKK